MTTLVETLEQLRQTHAEIARVEKLIAQYPEQKSLTLDVMSLEKRKQFLEEEFLRFAEDQQVDVCDYRLIPDSSSDYPISAVGACLQRFQDLFSMVFDAVKTGPKIRGRISADIAQESAFNFSYVYSGSLGFVFTVPNDRLLLIDSDVDRAADLVLAILNCASSDDIKSLIPEVGVAAVTKAHGLSTVHASYGFNSRIKWKKGKDVRHDIVLHAPQFERLKNIIDQTGDEQEERVTVRGNLVGLDVDTSYFHMKFPEADDIKGTLSDRFKYVEIWQIPGPYDAVIIRKTRLHYSTGQEDTSWELVKIEQVS